MVLLTRANSPVRVLRAVYVRLGLFLFASLSRGTVSLEFLLLLVLFVGFCSTATSALVVSVVLVSSSSGLAVTQFLVRLAGVMLNTPLRASGGIDVKATLPRGAVSRCVPWADLFAVCIRCED